MPALSELPPFFVLTVAICLGLTFGSFLNVVIYRLPLGLSVAYPGSRCPKCGVPVRAYDNVPVLSWLLLRGKARCCAAPISPRYPLIEFLGGLTGWALGDRMLALDPDTAAWRAALWLLLALCFCLGLIAAAFIDLEHMFLPDEITLGGTLLGILTVPLRPESSWLEALLGAGVGFLVVWFPFCWLYRLIRGQAGMGLGDAKLVMLVGAWLGWPATLFTLMAGAIQGTLVAIVVYALHGHIEEPEAVRQERAARRAQLDALSGEERRALEAELAADPIAEEPKPGLRNARLPFGPFLVVAALEFFFFREALLTWYWDFALP